MIHEVLPSDVEYVKGMLDESHSDGEILASLAARGLEPAKAAELVDTLRHGQTPYIPFPPGLPVARHHSDVSGRASNSPTQGKRHVSRGNSHWEKPKSIARSFWVVVLAVSFAIAIGYVLLQIARELAHIGVQPDI